MIYDCFPFFNELDLLDIRLHELNDVVDRFVIVEATLTHNGDKKPLYYEDNKKRFAKFSAKIIHVIVDDFSSVEDSTVFQERAWIRENIQRNAIVKGLSKASDKDLIIVSDLDEIPKAHAVQEAVNSYRTGAVVGFALANYCYFLNLRNVSNPTWGNDPKMADIATFKNIKTYDNSKYEVFVLPNVNQGATATRFRYVSPNHRIKNAGWHFSYCGGIETVVRKIRAFNEVGLFHRNDIDEYVRHRIAQNLILTGSDRCMADKLDAKFPKFILSNKIRFKHLIVNDSNADTMKQHILRIWFRSISLLGQTVCLFLFILTPNPIKKFFKGIFQQRHERESQT